MKTLSVTLFALLIASDFYAQDVITKNDSSQVKAYIIEINPLEIKYKLFNYPDGPMIISNRESIAYITFKNGLVERFKKSETKKTETQTYNPNTYNLDSEPVSIYNPEDELKKYDKLYTKKNYLGFNYIAFLNTALGFNYMRDIKKANLIINVPFAFGLGSPGITNSLYNRDFLDGTSTTKYQLMKYQVGVNALFAPSMNKAVNFLMGPSFNLTSYKMSVETKYTTLNAPQYQNNNATFTNSFILRRQHYGINIGFLARFSEKVNMNILMTFGYKKDTYNQKDPYGIDKMNADSKYKITAKDNVMPYVNFAWSVGYRF